MDIRTNPQWPALGAGGAVLIAPARYVGALFFHPPGRAKAPRANLAPRRITRPKCVIHRPDEWAYSTDRPKKDACDIARGGYLGRVYFRLCFVDVVRAAELKATRRLLGPRLVADGALYRVLAVPPGASAISAAELVSPSLSAKFATWGPAELNPNGRR